MSDNYFQENKKTQLTYWVTGQMLKGAGAAAVVLIGIGITLWVIYGIGLLLPAESRETPDPMAAIDMLRTAVTAFV